MYKPLLRPAGFVLCAAFVSSVSLAGCSGGGSTTTVADSTPVNGIKTAVPAATSAPVPTPTPTLAPLVPAVAPCTDCWPMFMGNAARTGLSTSNTGINSGTVSRLAVRWSYEIGEETAGSPITANGSVFVTTGAGSVYSFDERTGSINWTRSLGGPVTMTPTYDKSMIFVSTHNPPAQVFALDAGSGSTVWQTSLDGAVRGEPLAIGGTLYFPEAGGDPGECHQGGIHAYNELTGTPLWTWNVDSKVNDGGSVWSPISYDGRSLVFGTGNTCSENVPNANSVVQLSLGGSQDWRIPQEIDSYVDDDWGGGAMILGGKIYSANKNGYLYQLDDISGAVGWQVQQVSIDGEGSISSPASDGETLVVPAGFVQNSNTGASSYVGGYDLSGNLLWKVASHDIVPGGAAIANDVALLSIDSTIQAISLSTGASLWSYTPPSDEYFYSSPAVDSTGVYNVDTSGGVFAFGLSTATASPVPATQATIATVHPNVKRPFHVFYTTRSGAMRVRY